MILRVRGTRSKMAAPGGVMQIPSCPDIEEFRCPASRVNIPDCLAIEKNAEEKPAAADLSQPVPRPTGLTNTVFWYTCCRMWLRRYCDACKTSTVSEISKIAPVMSQFSAAFRRALATELSIAADEIGKQHSTILLFADSKIR